MFCIFVKNFSIVMNFISNKECVSVGDVIQNRLQELDMKQSDLSELTGINKPVLCSVIQGKRPLTADMAVVIEGAIQLGADYLMALECQKELNDAYAKRQIIEQLQALEDWDLIKDKISTNVLKKLTNIKGGIKDIIKEVYKIFNVNSGVEFSGLVSAEEKETYFKCSDKLRLDSKALFTWKHYCYYIATQTPISTIFYPDRIDNLVKTLNEIFRDNCDTLKRTQVAFEQFGIRLLYINKEGQVPVDGMSFWKGDNPTIILTRRLPNIDNFVFSAFHELGHLKLHIHKGMDTFIDYDGLSGQIEDEANEFAHNATIPQPVWTNFMDSFRNVNPFAIHKLIKELSDRFAVNPQILYGRYMHEKGLYRLKRVF